MSLSFFDGMAPGSLLVAGIQLMGEADPAQVVPAGHERRGFLRAGQRGQQHACADGDDRNHDTPFDRREGEANAGRKTSPWAHSADPTMPPGTEVKEAWTTSPAQFGGLEQDCHWLDQRGQGYEYSDRLGQMASRPRPNPCSSPHPTPGRQENQISVSPTP